jgi:beta-N-acetylhexosaminidase
VQDPPAVDAFLDGMATAKANGEWRPSEAGEHRRLALLPATRAQTWDDLMTHPDYMQAMRLLP